MEYAIGGSTLEMFCASYNQTHDIGIDYSYDTEDNIYGYNLKMSTEEDFSSSDESIMIDSTDDFYVISDAWELGELVEYNGGTCVF